MIQFAPEAPADRKISVTIAIEVNENDLKAWATRATLARELGAEFQRRINHATVEETYGAVEAL